MIVALYKVSKSMSGQKPVVTWHTKEEIISEYPLYNHVFQQPNFVRLVITLGKETTRIEFDAGDTFHTGENELPSKDFLCGLGLTHKRASRIRGRIIHKATMVDIGKTEQEINDAVNQLLTIPTTYTVANDGGVWFVLFPTVNILGSNTKQETSSVYMVRKAEAADKHGVIDGMFFEQIR